MSLSLIIMIILVIAMVVGPIMMVRPSAGQKRIAKLRNLAVLSGLRVATPPPQLGRSSVHYVLPIHEKIDTSPWVLVRNTYAHDLHFFDDWDWLNQESAIAKNQKTKTLTSAQHCKLKEACESAMPSIMTIGCNQGGLYVGWTEQHSGRTEEEAVAAIKAWLEALKENLFGEKGGQ